MKFLKNIKVRFLIMACFLLTISAFSQEMKPEETEDWSRKPLQLAFEGTQQIPSDAIILFSGKNTDKWQTKGSGKAAEWTIINSTEMQIMPGSGSIHTLDSFSSCQLHIEWKVPIEDVENGRKSQGCGNSGVFLMEQYEVQVLNSYENETYYNGQAGSVYKQHIPLVNASKKPEEWQSYDIVFTAPVFAAEENDSSLISPAYLTVIHNGVLIQNHVELIGPMQYIGIPVYKWHAEKLPILLQDHGNKVSYRNIWIRNL